MCRKTILHFTDECSCVSLLYNDKIFDFNNKSFDQIGAHKGKRNIINSHSPNTSVCSLPAVFMILISAVRIRSKGQVELEFVIHQPLLLKTNLGVSKATCMLCCKLLKIQVNIKAGGQERHFI